MILDLTPALRHVEAIERHTGFSLDEDDLFQVIFGNIEDERTAVRDIEERLLCIALDSVVDYDDLVMGSDAAVILNEIRHIAVRTYRELQSVGVYRNHRLAYSFHSRPFRNTAYFVERKHHAHDYAL